jgi:hypothetical protein
MSPSDAFPGEGGPARSRAAALAPLGRAAIAGLPAWAVLAGVAVGFGLCCFAGRVVSRRPMFEHFLRFHGPISPQGLFYPTASELVSYVEGTVPRSKYLVVVGGASFFRGAGQNPDELWTRELQRLLGDDYAVVNYAMDNGGITSCAGVAFQILAREYPRIAFVCNASPVAVDAVDGGPIYRYVFWDAYYKGMLSLPFPWSEGVRELARSERAERGGLELHLGKWIDRFTYACDLWTYLGYRDFFTVWSNLSPQAVTAPRRAFTDGVIPNLLEMQSIMRKRADYIRTTEETNKDFASKGFIRNARGEWERDPVAWEVIANLSTGMFPLSLRSKCFLVFIRANTFYMTTLTPDEWKRREEVYRLGGEAFTSVGYRVIQLPDADFSPDDYIDGGHYLASGGRKIARAVAGRILAARAAPGP